MWKKGIVFYFGAVNLLSIVFCMYDKIAAIKHWLRVPEKTLFWLAGLGGGVGMYLTMWFIHHKTLHKRFMLGIPAIVLLQIALIFAVYYLTK